jgi:hypothetical protein
MTGGRMKFISHRKMWVLKKAIRLWGPDFQLLTAAEECSELSAAIIKFVAREPTTERFLAVCEEFADVQIMLEQTRMVFHNTNLGECFDEAVGKAIGFKLRRLEGRMLSYEERIKLKEEG